MRGYKIKSSELYFVQEEQTNFPTQAETVCVLGVPAHLQVCPAFISSNIIFLKWHTNEPGPRLGPWDSVCQLLLWPNPYHISDIPVSRKMNKATRMT